MPRLYVSIRPSLQQRGERKLALSCGCPEVFQSTPHFSSEANLTFKPVAILKRGFNPRLTSAARRTSGQASHQHALRFQSTPHFSSEANSVFDSWRHKSKRFNPRLTSAARRTAERDGSGSADRCFNPRLTSAARRTPGKWVNQKGFEMFQSTPHFSSEANLSRMRVELRRSSFNPRLTSAARRTTSTRRRQYSTSVSILASLQQRGELIRIKASNPSITFQSTPHFSSEANLELMFQSVWFR